MLSVHKSRHTATLLHLSDGMQGEGGFAGALRAVNLNDAAFGVATTKGQIQGERTGGDGFNPHARGIPQPHDRPLTEVAFDLVQHQPQGLFTLSSRRLVGLGIGHGKTDQQRLKKAPEDGITGHRAMTKSKMPRSSPGVSIGGAPEEISSLVL